MGNNPATDGTAASSTGNLNFAYAQGINVEAIAGTTPSDTRNVAFNIANEPPGTGLGDNVVLASGTGNLAANLGGNTGGVRVLFVQAAGIGNVATDIGGTGNQVHAGELVSPSTFSMAFALGGTNNTVFTGPGPFDVAGAIGGTNKVVTNPPNPNIQ